MTEAELRAAYAAARITTAQLRAAAARVCSWTYIPSQAGKRLELAADIALLREALEADIAADELEVWPGLETVEGL